MMTAPIWLVMVLLHPMHGAAQDHPSTFTPAPCVERQWEYADPTFEPLPGAKAFFGKYDGGLYNIEIPDMWNGDLVLWQHANVAESNPLRVQIPLLRQHWIAKGFAWAASSFRCNGPVIGIGLLDTMALQPLVTQFAGGRPLRRVFLTGESNGGYGTIIGLRHFPSVFVAGLALCPASGVLGQQYRIAVADAANRISGIDLSMPSAQQQIQVFFGSPPRYTEAGRKLANLQVEMSGGPRPFAIDGLTQRFAPNIALPDNSDRYRAAKGDEALRQKYDDWAAFDGRIQKPLLTLHGTGDLTAPITNERDFKQAMTDTGNGQWLVQRIIRMPSHCRFSEQEEIAAFDDLVAWVQEGKRPVGDDVMADFRDAGKRFTNPLRPNDPGTLIFDAQ